MHRTALQASASQQATSNNSAIGQGQRSAVVSERRTTADKNRTVDGRQEQRDGRQEDSDGRRPMSTGPAQHSTKPSSTVAQETCNAEAHEKYD